MKIHQSSYDTAEVLLNPSLNDQESSSQSLTYLKWIGLILVCIYSFGRSWAFDNPSALEDSLISTLNLSSEQYNLFYTAYSVPNYILPLFSGFLVDKYGLKFGILCFGSLILIGQFFFWLGCVFRFYEVAFLGRVLFGIGGESSLLVKYCMLVVWFDNKELGFVSGATFLTQRLGSFFNSLLTPKIYQATQSLGWSTFVGFLVCLLSWLCGLIWLALNKVYKRRMRGSQQSISEPTSVKKPQIKQLFQFQKFTYIFTLLSILYLSVFISFTANGNDFLQKQYGFSQSQAGNVLSPLFLVAGVFTPIFGKVIDILGGKMYIIIISFIFEAASMFLFLILPTCFQCYIGLVPLACFGLSSALFSSAYWPAVNLLEKKENIGLVMGFFTVGYNIGEGVYPALVGVIEDKTKNKGHGYYYVMLFLGFTACLGLLISIFVEVLNRKYRKGLNKKAKS